MPRKKSETFLAREQAKKAGQSVVHPNDTLPINQVFAHKFEQSSRRKLLNSAPAAVLDKDSEESEESSSEEEDEFGELLTKGIDRRVRDTIEALKNKDPRIYDSKVKFFETEPPPADDAEELKDDDDHDNENDSEESGDDDEEVGSDDEPVAGWDAIAAAASNDAPKLTVKDYVRENLLKHGKLSDDESDGNADDDDHVPGMHSDTQFENGENNRKQKLEDEVDGDGNGSEDDFFVKRELTTEEQEEEERNFQVFLDKQSRKKAKTNGEDLLLHSYLEKENPDEKERFLRDFVLNNGWLNKNAGDAPRAADYAIEVDLPQRGSDDDESGEESDDDDNGEKKNAAKDDEEFDMKADAFEANYNYRFEEAGADHITSHARVIPDSMRRPDERRKLAREARRDRKNRERALKIEDLKRLKNEKKRDIQARLLAIQEAAGDDVDINGMDLDGDFDPDKFNEEMERRFGDDYYAREDEEMNRELGKGVEHASEKRVQAKEGLEAPEDVRKDVDKLMEEYYNLDFEDIVGGTPMRFNYKQVEEESFGLTTQDILEKDDKELNRVVSLKYLAPYQSRRHVQKQAWKARERLNQNKRRRGSGPAEGAESGRVEEAQSGDAGGTGETASQKKRKKRKALKLGTDGKGADATSSAG